MSAGTAASPDTSRAPTRAASTSALTDAPTTATSSSVSLFVSDRTAPRHRRTSDLVRLGFGFGVFALLGWVSSTDPGIDRSVLRTANNLAGWIHSFGLLAFGVASLVVLAIVIVALARAGRGRGLVNDLVWALVIAGAVGGLATWLTGGPTPDLVPEFFDDTASSSFPTFRVAVVVIATLVLAPYVTAPVMRLLRWSSITVVVAALAAGVATVTGVSGALALSAASVAAVRFVFGSPEGLPAVSHLANTLAAVGANVTDLAYRDHQPGTVGLATATSESGQPLQIKIYGIDAASRQRAERVWNALWYRTAGPSPNAGRIEQAQHEALALMTARLAGVDVPEVRAAGRTTSGDVLLVTGGVNGVRLSDVEETPTPATLATMWATLLALHHRAHITHGRLDATTIRLGDGGSVQLTDLAHSSLLPTQQQYATDLVSMLVIQALATSTDTAVDAAVAAIGPTDLETCLPFVQDAVVAPRLRTALRHAGIKVDAMRAELAHRLGVETPHPAPIKRVDTKDLIVAIFAIIAANSLISQIANIGLASLSDEWAKATYGWFVVAFLIRLFGFVNAAWGFRVIVDQPIPMLPTTLLQSAKTFVGLAVPSVAGQNGLDLRYLQKQGVPMSVATMQGPMSGLIGFVGKIVLLALSAWSIGQNVDTSTLNSSGGGGLILIAVVVVAIGIIAILAVPKWRAKVVPAVRAAIASLKHMISSPRVVGAEFISQALGQIISALALAAVVVAFGANVSFPALLFVTIGTGMLAGLSPVPGGIGVAEATMSGLLTAVGLDPQQSFTIAITFRLFTSYLPPVLGFFSLRWLTKQGYL